MLSSRYRSITWEPWTSLSTEIVPHRLVKGYNGLRDGEQHALSFTWDSTGGEYEIYVDGSLSETGSQLAEGHTLAAGGTLLFGQAQNSEEGGFDTGEVFSGNLHNARLFSDVRTAEEIAASFRSELFFNEPDMLAQWNFEKLSADGIITESVSGNNLTVKHTSESGFSPSSPQMTLIVDENALDTTVVGKVAGVDSDRDARIATLLANDDLLVYSAETEKFYKYWDASGNFEAATSNADSQLLNGIGGELATIYSAHEQALVLEAYTAGQDEDVVGIAWLGASDAKVEGEWRWQSSGVDGDLFWLGDSNGSSVDGSYNAFATGQPNNSNNTQNFLAIQSDNTWGDYASDSGSTAMLQWDADAVLDATDALTYSIQSQTVADAFVIDGSTGEISVANGLLLDYESNVAHTLIVRTSDEGEFYDEDITVSLRDVDDTPPQASQTVPDAQTVEEDGVLTFSSTNIPDNALSVSDSLRNTDAPMRISLSVSDGVLTLSQTTGLDFIEGSNGSDSLVIDGAESAINAALEGMSFTPDADFNGNVSISMSSMLDSSQSNQTDEISINVSAVNDAPVAVEMSSTSIATYDTAVAAFDFENGTDSTASGGPALNVESPVILSVDDGFADGGTGLLFPTGDVNSATHPVSISTIPGIATSEEFSFTAFVRFDAGEGNRAWERIFDFGGSNSNNLVFGRNDRTDDLFLKLQEDGGSGSIFIRNALAGIEGEWHHYGVSIDSSGYAQVFIDGVFVQETELKKVPNYTAWNTNYIGSSHGTGDRQFQGAMDDIAIFDSALTAEQMFALSQKRYSVVEQQPLILHGTGMSVSDVDDNGGPLTATLSVGDGSILVDVGNSGVTLSSVVSTDTIRFDGTKTQINNLLEGSGTGTIVYIADSDAPSATTPLTLSINDQGNTGSDPGLTADSRSERNSVSQTINITTVNDSPEILGKELITNGNFDNGNLVGWATDGRVTNVAESLNFGSANVEGPHTASQTITTVAGETYTLEFDYRDVSNTGNQQLQVTVDGIGNLLTTEQIVSDIAGVSFVTYRYEFTADSTMSTITFTDTSDDAGSTSNNTNRNDGQLDNISIRKTASNTVYAEQDTAVVIDADMTLFDAELTDMNDFGGSTLTLVRSGGANVEDVFSATANLVFNGTTLELSSTEIGTFSNADGTLTVSFKAGTSQAQVDEAIQSIAYANTSDTPPSDIQIDWSFNDGNTGSQGSGPSLSATKSTTVVITAINDAPVNTVPAALTVSEETSTTLGGISVADVDADGADITTRLQVSDGVLNVALGDGANISAGANDSADITLSGSVLQINAALASLRYTGDTDVVGPSSGCVDNHHG